MEALEAGAVDTRGVVNRRYRNDCGEGGEDCSLCMVSGVAGSYWTRWMLLSESKDGAVVYVARGAPRRWYASGGELFGIAGGPTRFGKVHYAMRVAGGAVAGSVRLEPRPGGVAAVPLVAVKLRAEARGRPLSGAVVLEGGRVVAWHAANETAVVELGAGLAFNFSAR